MQLAVSLPPTLDLERFGASIGRIEALGFDMAYTPDQGFLRDPFVALAHAATRTRRIALGLGVTTPYTRHPAYIARAAATIADLRTGNFILGLGSGERANLRDRLNAAKTPFLPLLRETIRVLRELFAGRTVWSETPAFTLRNISLEFEPRHPVPIYIATTDPAGFRLAGEIADGLILGDIADPDALNWAVDLMREGARGAGRDPADVTVVAWVSTIIDPDRAAIKDKLRRVMAMAIGGMHHELRLRLGFDAAVSQRVKLALRSDVIDASVIDDAALDRLMIAGASDYCLERIQRLAAAGADQLSARMPAAVAHIVDFETNVRQLAERILPRLHSPD